MVVKYNSYICTTPTRLQPSESKFTYLSLQLPQGAFGLLHLTHLLDYLSSEEHKLIIPTIRIPLTNGKEIKSIKGG